MPEKVNEYLTSIKPWDGKPRLETFLIDHLGAQDTPMIREISEKFFTAAVGRALKPGLRWRKALLLHGNNRNADLFMDTLIGRQEWICKGLNQRLSYWFVDVSPFLDMDIPKEEIWISSLRFESFLRDRIEEDDEPRPCVFYAKTEKPKFLYNDSTDFVWCIVPIHPDFQIDVEKLKQERDQIWAESLSRWLDSNDNVYLSFAHLKEVTKQHEKYRNLDYLPDYLK